MKRGNFWFASGLALLCLPLVILAVSCGGGGGDSGGSGSTGTGTMNLSLTDASTTDCQAIYVSIKQVEVHRDGGAGWEVVSTPDKTYNLLDLVNGVREQLALAELASGHYTQMRLILKDTPDDSINILSRKHPYANYFIDRRSGESIELKVPSGFQTGIKIVKGFDINDNQTTELILDFDAARSIVKAGSSGKWLLKPTIKMLNTKEYSIIEGNAGQEGVLVSAQVYNRAAAPEKAEDKVEVKAATVTGASGNYKLFLEPGIYTLVGYEEGFLVFYKKDTKIVIALRETQTHDFDLTPASSTGPLTISISISGVDPEEQYATVSIRQGATVGGILEQIEVRSFNVADGGTFNLSLPYGDYTAVVSSYSKGTIATPFTIPRDPAVGNLEFNLQ
jgi:hypothetical protein